MADGRKRPDGKFDVTVTVEAKKLYADGKGKETAASLNETMDIGLFTAEPGKKGFGRKVWWLMSAGRSARACRP
jgi:ABC-2 type transport system permease protein